MQTLHQKSQKYLHKEQHNKKKISNKREGKEKYERNILYAKQSSTKICNTTTQHTTMRHRKRNNRQKKNRRTRHNKQKHSTRKKQIRMFKMPQQKQKNNLPPPNTNLLQRHNATKHILDDKT